MSHIGSYPKVYGLGHRAIKDIFSGPVVLQEKVDGSQFSFGLIDGKLCCRSKGAVIDIDAPDSMFAKAVESVLRCQQQLQEGWVYRCEYLRVPKHNTLKYDRVPDGNLVLFDIQVGNQEFAHRDVLKLTAFLLHISVVPEFGIQVIASGQISETLNKLLDTESFLGGTKIEGVVFKNYDLFTDEKTISIGKYVSEAFKEVHGKDWKNRNPTGKDFAALLIDTYRTEARWEKAIQHLRDRGELLGDPRDIGPLLKEIQTDVLEEEGEAIKAKLFAHFWKQISRGLTAGFPEWYKKKLVADLEEAA